MDMNGNESQEFALAFAAAWNRLERQLDSSLGSIKGISLAEYRILRTLSIAPKSHASRVDLANAVGLTPSGVTRALRPLEKLGMVSTVKSQRDARLAMATLTSAGESLVSDASGVLNDTMTSILGRAPKLAAKLNPITELLDSVGR
jgi:DNA-binding MarR family transcriptional regulator